MIHSTIKYKIIFILCCHILFFPILKGDAREKTPIGKVIAVRGSVIAVDPDLHSRPLILKAPVFLKDTIQTKNGRIQMMFNDNTLMTLGRNTEMKITKYLWKPGDKQSTMETEVGDGSFRIMGGAITRIAPRNFKTHAPSGTIGIRGSMYAGRVKGDLLSVVFQGGKGIYIQNKAGMVNITRPGFGTKVKSRAQAPEKPKKMDSRELLEIDNSLAASSEESGEKLGMGDETENSSADTVSTEETSSDTGAESTSSESTSSESTSSESSATAGSSETSGSGIPANKEVAPAGTQMSGPVSVSTTPVDTLPDLSSIISDATLTSTQEEINNSIPEESDNSAPLTESQKQIFSVLSGLGFSGSESITIPTSGIWKYTGKLINTLVDEPDDNIKFIVNWHNKRIIGLEDDLNHSDHINFGFGFGTIDSSGNITHLKVLGSDSHYNNSVVTALTGSETYGHVYGTNQTGIGLAMEGYDVDIQNQTDKTFWSDIAGAVVNSKTTVTSSGTETWKGFFVGVSENMASPYSNRRVFLNDTADDFALTIDKDAGTFTGSLSGQDFISTDNSITGITLGGGSTNSVYITDHLLAASISGNGSVSSQSSTGSLKTSGNYMVSADKTELSEYTTWGYWEIAYSEPGTANDYHLHVPGALWIAGSQTPASVVDGLISSSFTGTYTGRAAGVMFDDTTQMTELTNGAVSLLVDFASTATQPVSGNISFDQVTLPVTSNYGNLTRKGFNATVSSATHSLVNGAFYGPNANGVGGNFSAKMSDGKQYHGIFAGDR